MLKHFKPSELRDFGIEQSPNDRYRETKRRWYLKNREKQIATAKAWREANPERFKELRREWERRNKTKKRRYTKVCSWRRAGIPKEFTHEEYDKLFQQQFGRCAICGDPPTPKRALAVDHEHLTGRVRGLLCTRCNMGMGYFKTPKMLKYAYEYAEKNTVGIRVPTKEELEKHNLL